jgi:NAD(P)-dependent dehydrogenase (short-subunit alcohol dehydrogenase family)
MPMTERGAIIVTGAASGIGLATARLLAGGGVPVVGIDREPVPDLGPRGHGLTADLSDAAQIEQSVSSAFEAVAGIAGLINCAGVYPVTPMLEMDPGEWDRVLSVNLRAPFLMTRGVARRWSGANVEGVVVNVASTAAVLARPGTTHYAASKAGLVQLTRVMAIELAPLGIRVNAVAPGLIATDRVMAHAASGGAAEHKAKLARIPAGRAGAPEEVARAIRWLLSDEAAYSTGSVLTLDGGFTLGIPVY